MVRLLASLVRYRVLMVTLEIQVLTRLINAELTGNVGVTTGFPSCAKRELCGIRLALREAQDVSLVPNMLCGGLQD